MDSYHTRDFVYSWCLLKYKEITKVSQLLDPMSNVSILSTKSCEKTISNL